MVGRSRHTTVVLTTVTLGWFTICPAAPEELNTPAQGTVDRLKTRTELLNELNLRSAWQSPEQIRALLNIENVIVSIVDANASIGKPYEKIIPVLPYEGEKKVAFELLTDVRQAGIKLQYLQQVVTENIYLEKESLQEIPTVVATQFSQEGTLGADIHYLLELEMLVTTERRFALTVTSLPPQINFSFVDQTSNARVTSVRFDENVSKHSLALRLSIPQKLDISMIDKTINLQAWAVPPQQLEALNALRAEYNLQDIPQEELGPLQAARVDLALIPKGSARLEILIDNLYGMFTARQNLRFFAELGGRKGLKNQELDDVMRSVGLPEKALTMRLKNFSKGMRQKLGIAIALIKDPPAIIMDEPTSGLDPKSANEFLEQLRKLRQRGKAILMTTHDIFRAKQIADRVGIMKQGRLVAVREKADFRHADLEEIYLTEMAAAKSAV